MKKQAGMFLVAVAAFVIGASTVNLVPPARGQDAEAKKAVWTHGFNVAVRKPGEQLMTNKTKAFGIEVYRDENNGNLIYVSETGSISVVPRVVNQCWACGRHPARSILLRKLVDVSGRGQRLTHAAAQAISRNPRIRRWRRG